MCIIKQSKMFGSTYSHQFTSRLIHQEFCYYLLMVKSVRYVERCNTFNDLSNKERVPIITVTVKSTIYVKNIIFGILLLVVAKIVNIYQVLLIIHLLLVTKL